MNPVALLLADGRWPGGGYAHSSGLEPAVEEGAVRDAADLEQFVAGRLSSSAVTDAWTAAMACAAVLEKGSPDEALPELLHLQRSCEARLPSPALRKAGRALGRGLRRTVEQCWGVALDRAVEQYPLVLGAACGIAGLTDRDAAELVVHHALFGPLAAAPKLMAIDMTDACAIAVRLAPSCTAAVDEALAATSSGDEPMWSSPLVELRAERHATWEVRLFAS